MTEETSDTKKATFEELGVEQDILAGLRDLGYEYPLLVQLACMEPILAGQDLSVRSKTGTGKTAAFGIPLLQRLEAGDGKAPRLQALIMAPTRELAGQIAAELASIGKHKGIQVVAAYGGASLSGQIRALEAGAHVVVGTPGRLLDLVRRRVLRPAKFETVVLDEADEMLSMGFIEDVTNLMDACTSCQQVIILSASLEAETKRLVDNYATDVIRIDLSTDSLSVEGIRNIVYTISDELPRHHYLLHVLAEEQPVSAIVFVNTRKDASLVATILAREGWQAEMISGELPQSERERVMASIRLGKLKVLVATDLASRGIDISDLSHVINYSLPEDANVYLHRVGRTGRVDRQGTAVSLVSGSRLRTLGELERKFRVRFEERKFPPRDKMISGRTNSQIAGLVEAADSAICDGYLEQARAVVGHEQSVDIVAYLLKRHADQTHDEQRAPRNLPQQSSGRGRKPSSRPPRNRGGRNKGGGRRS